MISYSVEDEGTAMTRMTLSMSFISKILHGGRAGMEPLFFKTETNLIETNDIENRKLFDIHSVGWILILTFVCVYIFQLLQIWLNEFQRRPRRSEASAPSNGPRPILRPLWKQQLKQKRDDDHSLNMDHLHLTLWNYLIFSFLITPNTSFLLLKGVFELKIREIIQSMGLINPQCHNMKKLVAEFLLESCACVIHYTGQDNTGIASFDFQHLPTISSDGDTVTIVSLHVEIDLNKREMATASLNGKIASPDDVACLIWFATISADHVKLHSLSNWAYPDSFSKNWRSMSEAGIFHQRMSNISVTYNYFGFTVFPRTCKLFYNTRLIPHNVGNAIKKVFEAGCLDGIRAHSNIIELTNHSSVVNFVVRLRSKFLFHFHRHCRQNPNDFLGVDAESLFVSTILHSIDHHQSEVNLKDPLWLDYNKISPEYQIMVDIGRIVRVGFVPDVPGLLFRRKYKDVKHLPFYGAVYREACKIDERLANEMDTAIIK